MSEMKMVNSTDVIDHVFPNGSKFTGTFDQLKEVAKALRQPLTGLKVVPRGWYNSETRGLVEIKTLNSVHIRNTLLKESKAYMSKIFQKGDTNTQFLEKYSGLVTSPLVEDLLNELVSRGDDPAKEPDTKKVATVSAAKVSPSAAKKVTTAPKKAAPKKAAAKKATVKRAVKA